MHRSFDDWQEFLAQAAVRAERQRYIIPACNSVTPITPAEPTLADTSNNREAIPRPKIGENAMFANDTRETILTKVIMVSLLAAFVATLFV